MHSQRCKKAMFTVNYHFFTVQYKWPEIKLRLNLLGLLKNKFSPCTSAVAYPGVLTTRDVVAIIVAFSGPYTYKCSQFRSMPLVQLANSIMGWVCRRPTTSCTHTLKHLYNKIFLNRARFSKLGNWALTIANSCVVTNTSSWAAPKQKHWKPPIWQVAHIILFDRNVHTPTLFLHHLTFLHRQIWSPDFYM